MHIFCKRSFRHSHDLMTRTNTNMNGTLYNTRGDYLAWCNKFSCVKNGNNGQCRNGTCRQHGTCRRHVRQKRFL
ncbi:unnamed protein product [Rhizophagus irregularis]|nr:unnamed protein product [Rhizophagus irregularis]